MHLIYNSEAYSVVEFGVDNERAVLQFGGFDIMDKSGQRELFIGGSHAEQFRHHVQELIAGEPSIEEIDLFLAEYDEFMQQRMTMH